MKDICKKDVRKIFLRMPDWVGTLVLAIPVLKNIRNNFPDSFISVCVRKWSKDLLLKCPYIDEIIEYDSKNNSLKYQLNFIKNISSKNFDLAIILPGSFNSALITFLAGIKFRLGYSGDYRKFLLTHSTIDKGDKFFTNLLSNFGLKIDEKIKPELWISDGDSIIADKIWLENQLSGNEVIGIGPGVKGEKNRVWPIENIIELINSLDNKYKIVLFGSDNHKESCEKIQKSVKKNISNLTGKLSVNQFTSCVKKCYMYITNDTGGMHIASILGIHTIALFGPTDPEVWGPAGINSYVLRKKISCNPCEYKKMKNCKDNICMKSITVQDVLDEVKKII